MITLGEVSIEEVLPFMAMGVERAPFKDAEGNNHLVKVMLSLRLRLFYRSLNTTNPLKCAACSRVGVKFLLQKHESDNNPHLNLFSEDGTLMTKDHIRPKSKGGKDRLDNLQVMCVECNHLKDDKFNENTY